MHIIIIIDGVEYTPGHSGLGGRSEVTETVYLDVKNLEKFEKDVRKLVDKYLLMSPMGNEKND